MAPCVNLLSCCLFLIYHIAILVPNSTLVKSVLNCGGLYVVFVCGCAAISPTDGQCRFVPLGHGAVSSTGALTRGELGMTLIECNKTV